MESPMKLEAALLFILGSLALGAPACGPQEEEHLPPFTGDPLRTGALLCLSSSFSAKAPNLERAAILAVELVNGSTRPLPDIAPGEIPCRQNETCGVWVGRDASGRSLRGPLEINIANTEEHVARGVEAAARLRDEHAVPVIFGPCAADVMEAVFREVTGTDVVLISPTVSADQITYLDDRTAAEAQAQLPGWVYRTVTPDYVQTRFLDLLGSNSLPSKPLVRFEDRTDIQCSSDGDCAGLGTGMVCRESTRSAEPEKDYINLTPDVCTDEPADYCDSHGRNYECVSVTSDREDEVCAQFRVKKFCTRVVQPVTALVLYESSVFGNQQRDEARDFWVNRQGKHMLSERSFDPGDPTSFPETIQTLFADAYEEFIRLKAQSQLPAESRFADSVVFLFASATQGALLLQEWSTQVNTLFVAGADRVFWLGPDALRNNILVNQLNFATVRNLHVISPAAVSNNNGPFFAELFQARWGIEPGDFAANLFDAIVLVALANERAGYLRGQATSGALEPNSAAEIKASLLAVAAGCITATLTESCEDVLGAQPQAIPIRTLANAMTAAATGVDFRLDGVTGDLSFSPAGDRISEISVWKVEAVDGKGRFFKLEAFTPQASGINLER